MNNRKVIEVITDIDRLKKSIEYLTQQEEKELNALYRELDRIDAGDPEMRVG